MGIDFSLNRSGYVVINLDGGIVTTGLIENKKKLRAEQRLAYIFNSYASLFFKFQNKLLAIGLEGYSFGSRGGMAFSIGEGGGMVKLLLYNMSKQYSVPYYTFAPTSVKKFVTGKGNIQKSHMLKYVDKLWMFDNDDEDIVDAFSIAQLTKAYHAYANDIYCSVPYKRKYQLDVIKALYKKRFADGKKN